MKRLLLIAVGIILAGSAQADAINWDGSESTDWSNDDNWVGGVEPTSADYAYINQSIVAMISGGYDAVSSRNYVGSSTEGHLTITGSGSTLTSASLTEIGRTVEDGSSMNVLAGGEFISTSTIRIQRAILTIDGAGSKASTTGTFTTSDGQSRLTISAGGLLETFGTVYQGNAASSTFTITGVGSKWVSSGPQHYVGYSTGFGGQYILDGGLLQVTQVNALDADVGYVYMDTHGQLALKGTAATMDLNGFLDLTGDETVANGQHYRYYNGVTYTSLLNGAQDTDYTIEAGTGDLSGYTVLSVPAPVPAPSTITLLVISCITMLFFRHRLIV